MKKIIDWPSRGHRYNEKELNVVNEVLTNNSTLTQGEHVKNFETKFQKYINSNNAFALMSAAHALDISAMLIEIQDGDEVIMPSHTYCATALAFARRGAIIKWADIDPNSFTVTLNSIEKLISKKTKAIVVVHLYGLICKEIFEIKEFAYKNNCFLIEDCAQSLGAKLNGKHCGTIGDIGCYSFHSQKNLTTLGEGGMITVKDEKLAKKVLGLRINGHSQFENKTKYWLPAMVNVDLDIDSVWPIKSTMNEVQAALGATIIERMDQLTEQRRKRGLLIREKLKDCKDLIFQEIYKESAHSHHLLPARCNSEKWNRDDLIEVLYNQFNVKAIVQYYPLNRYDLFKKTGFAEADTPNTDSFFDNMISFPFSLTIDDSDFNYMIDSIKKSVQLLNS